VLLQSSKSSACAAVPLTSAASSIPVMAERPKRLAGPVAAMSLAAATAPTQASSDPASVTPTVSSSARRAASRASRGMAASSMASAFRASCNRSMMPYRLLKIALPDAAATPSDPQPRDAQ
jgi:hypothetical protein